MSKEILLTPSEDEWLSYFDSLSNWGRWGKEDVAGTLNHIATDAIVQACQSVREGLTVSCGRVIEFADKPPVLEAPMPPLHFMVRTGQDSPPDSGGGASDWIGLPIHGLYITHIDAHSHMFWKQSMYNGRPARSVAASGARKGSIHDLADGIIARGVLIDVGALNESDYVGDSYAITGDDLNAAAGREGVSVRTGDVILVRTGYGKRRAPNEASGQRQSERGRGDSYESTLPNLPGLGAASLPWMFDNEVSVVGTDTGTDARPSHYSFLAPFHSVALCAMGMWIIDNLELEELARTCQRLARWDFLIAIAPLRLKNSTGSPVNPIAVF